MRLLCRRLFGSRSPAKALWLVVPVAIAGLLPSGSSAEVPGRSVRWLSVETDNFLVLSDARSQEIERVARSLEGLQSVLETMASAPRSGVKPLVVAFRDRRPFRRYYHGRGSEEVAGFFTGSMLRNYLAVDLSRDQFGSTVYHELLHEFAAVNLPGVPLWFNEGLAEYYSTFVLDANTAEVGRPIESHVRWLRANRLRPMSEIMAVTTASAAYNEGNRRGNFYAQAWVAVHYLLSAEERAAGLRRFLQASEQGETVEAAFERSFDFSLGEFDRALERYVQTNAFPFSRIEAAGATERVIARSVPRPRALTLLAELLTAQQDVASARAAADEHLDAALAHGFEEKTRTGPEVTGTTMADALGLKAWLRWIDGDRSGARALFRRATQDVQSLFPRMLRGALELEELMSNAPLGAPGPEHPLAAVAQQNLEEALRLRPGWLRAQTSLGLTYLYRGDPAQGLELMEEVVSKHPADERGWLGLSLLSAKLGDFDRAWRVSEALEELAARLPRRVDARMVGSGRRNLAVLHVNHAIALSNSGEDAEALEQLGLIEARLSPAERKRFGETLAEIRTTSTYNQAVDRFNRIVVVAQQGGYREAFERLDRWLREGNLRTIDVRLFEQASELRDRLREVP